MENVRSTPPAIVLLWGPNCTGKSTLGHAVAGRLARGALIEVDALRYMVVGGLVALSRGTHPSEAPEEYVRQCALGAEQSARLALGFAASGFSSVIEGLPDAWRPPANAPQRFLPGLPVLQVALVCETDELMARIARRRDWDGPPREWVERELAWYESHCNLFDMVIDTSQGDVDQLSASILSALQSSAFSPSQ